MSLADQDFDRTKSLGIFNVSTRLTERLAAHKAVESMVVLTNLSIERRLSLPPEVDRIRYDEAVEGRWSRMLWDQVGVYRATREAGLPWLFMPKGYA